MISISELKDYDGPQGMCRAIGRHKLVIRQIAESGFVASGSV